MIIPFIPPMASGSCGPPRCLHCDKAYPLGEPDIIGTFKILTIVVFSVALFLWLLGTLMVWTDPVTMANYTIKPSLVHIVKDQARWVESISHRVFRDESPAPVHQLSAGEDCSNTQINAGGDVTSNCSAR